MMNIEKINIWLLKNHNIIPILNKLKNNDIVFKDNNIVEWNINNIVPPTEENLLDINDNEKEKQDIYNNYIELKKNYKIIYDVLNKLCEKMHLNIDELIISN